MRGNQRRRVVSSFTRTRLRLVSAYEQPPHTDVLRNAGTASEMSCLGWQKRPGQLLGGPRSFSGHSQFCISFGNQREPRGGMERHRIQGVRSPETFPQTVRIWGNVSSAGVSLLNCRKSEVNAAVYQILEHLNASVCSQASGRSWFLFPVGLTRGRSGKSTKP